MNPVSVKSGIFFRKAGSLLLLSESPALRYNLFVLARAVIPRHEESISIVL